MYFHSYLLDLGVRFHALWISIRLQSAVIFNNNFYPMFLFLSQHCFVWAVLKGFITNFIVKKLLLFCKNSFHCRSRQFLEVFVYLSKGMTACTGHAGSVEWPAHSGYRTRRHTVQCFKNYEKIFKIHIREFY